MEDAELLNGFCDETQTLLNQLSSISDELEETGNTHLFEDFGQVIDRIMGAAYTLELQEIGRFCELGKKIGYKASQADDPKLIELAGPILADTTEILQAMISGLINKDSSPSRETLEAFGTRLKWFLEKLQHIQRDTTNS